MADCVITVVGLRVKAPGSPVHQGRPGGTEWAAPGSVGTTGLRVARAHGPSHYEVRRNGRLSQPVEPVGEGALGSGEHTESFGYGYFDDPDGLGYRGYERCGNQDRYVPWSTAREFCLRHGVKTAIDLGCAKGFLVNELLSAGITAVGYDVSDYALSFTQGLPCYRHNLRAGVPGTADAVFALGVLLYLQEDDLDSVLHSIRRAARRFLLVSGFYAGDDQEVADPLRRITRSYGWWRARIEAAGFQLTERGEAFDVYEPTTGLH